MDDFQWLSSWYAAHCDGEWEHVCGIKLVTLDNPGWSLTIDLRDTELEKVFFTRQTSDGASWYFCSVEDCEFHGRCGPGDLPKVLAIFRNWASAPNE